jgi:hypothetical protein
VDHRCYQCGATVQDGVSFCLQCNAPQIRVSVAEPSSPLDAGGEIRIPRPSYSGAPRGFNLEWAHALPSAFLGLLIGSILSGILQGAFALAMVPAGFLSVYFYHRRNPLVGLTVGLGARLGAISGALGFGILGIVSAVATFMVYSVGEIRALVLKAVQEYLSRNVDPQMQQVQMQQFLEIYNSRQGFILMLVLGSIVMFIIFLALSSIGGIIGAAVFRRKKAS